MEYFLWSKPHPDFGLGILSGSTVNCLSWVELLCFRPVEQLFLQGWVVRKGSALLYLQRLQSFSCNCMCKLRWLFKGKSSPPSLLVFMLEDLTFKISNSLSCFSKVEDRIALSLRRLLVFKVIWEVTFIQFMTLATKQFFSMMEKR